MQAKAFQRGHPGTLVPTVAFEERFRGKLVEKIPVPGKAFVPDPLPPNLNWNEFVGRIRDVLVPAERALARLDGRASGLTNPNLLLWPFWRREARLSSQIEDTIATPEEIAMVAAGEEPARDDPREVYNYIRALQHGLDSKLPLVSRLIREMHRVLLEGVRGDDKLPGEFRREQNYIGNKARGFAEARFVPPPPGEPLERSVASLERFMNRPPREIPELIAIALAHYQFECIHPFRDGNGRVGRLLIALSLCRLGLLSKPFVYVSAFIEKNREKYNELLLRVSTHADWEAWVRFMLEAIASQAIDADRRVDRLLVLREELATTASTPRTSALVIKLLDYLFESPIVTVSQVRRVLNVTDTAARNHLAALMEHGVLTEYMVVGRKQYYIAQQIVDVAEAETVEAPKVPELEAQPAAHTS